MSEPDVHRKGDSDSDSSSSSLSCGSYKREETHLLQRTFPERKASSNIKNTPTKTTQWKLQDLENVGVFYEESPISLSEFMYRLQGKRIVEKHNLTKLPSLSKKLIALDEQLWTFTMEFTDEELVDAIAVYEQVDVVEKTIENFKNHKIEAKTDLTKELEDDHGQVLFHKWQFCLLEFWNYCCIILSRWNKSFQREGKFTNLFMAFSKIFHLEPEPGGSYSEVFTVQSTLINGVPDLRFITYRNDADGRKVLKIMITTRVDMSNTFKSPYTADGFTYQNLSSEALGQHGVELMMERTDSYFFPGVVGIIGSGTKLIFTYLELTQAHYEKIIMKSEKDHALLKSYISYTRPYDFMDVHDRKELLGPLTWLGYLQSAGYSIYKYRYRYVVDDSPQLPVCGG